MNLSDLGKVVAQFAPQLGAVLAGPAGAMIGAGIAAKFGGDAKDPVDLAKRIQADPQAQVKLAEIQSDMKIAFREFDSEDYKTEVDDRKNVRWQAVELRKMNDNTQRNLAYIIIISFIASIFVIFFFKAEIDQTEKEIAAILLGVLTREAMSVVAAYFGDLRTNRNNL